jgi:serine/threonine-protein kinase
MGRAALAAPHGWRSAGHPDTPLEPGSVLAERYAIQATLGAGGMGVVYRAVDLVLGETVAVKVLRPGLLAADPLARERLKDELRLARRISHRNVVRTHDFGESAGVPFITMEYVDGASLDALIRAGGAVPAPAVLSIAKQLCRALRVAHEQGVIHGDLKPQNLLVRPGGVLKVTDFGVARLVRAQREAPARSAEDRPRLAGAVVGTPEYMAPEQLLGEEPSVHSDLYATGVVLRECLTGVTPFAADTPLAFFSHKLEAAASPPVHPGLAAWAARRSRSGTDAWADALDAVVERLTARDPDERPASADALHDLLARLG